MSDEETGGAGSQLEPYSDDSDGDRRSGKFFRSFFKKRALALKILLFSDNWSFSLE